MNQTVTHAVFEAIIATLSENDPAFAARLATRLEAVAARADDSGWRYDGELVRKLFPTA